MGAAAPMVRTKTPGVYRRGSRYVAVYRDADGKQRKASARTLDDARRLKREREVEASAGGGAKAQNETFPSYALSWMETFRGKRTQVRDRTRNDYVRHMERYALRFFSPRLKLRDLTPGHVDAFVQWLLDGKGGSELKSATVSRVLVPLRHCLDAARRDNLIVANPADGVSIPAQIAVEDRDPKAMTRDELRRILENVKPEWRLLFEVFASTGARWSEVVAWEKRDFDAERRVLMVRRTLHADGEHPVKTEASQRDISLSPALAEKLERHCERLDDHSYIFSNDGAALRYPQMRAEVLKPAAAAAGCEWVGFHNFRHTAASMMFEKTKNILEVQRLLGHSSASFTMRTYVHLLSKDDGVFLELDLGEAAGLA